MANQHWRYPALAPTPMGNAVIQKQPQQLPQTNSPPSIRIFTNAVYYPARKARLGHTPFSSLNPQAISHIYYASARLNPDGSVGLSDHEIDAETEVDGMPGCLRSCTALRDLNPHLKVVLSIGGEKGSQLFPRVSGDAVARERFARSARNLIDDFSLDGLDVDWEYPTSPREGDYCIRLLERCRAYLPRGEYLLTLAVSGLEWYLQHMDVRQASFHLDLLNVMCWDFSGSWYPMTGHHSQLYPRTHPDDRAITSCHSVISYLRRKGVPAEKIVLGVPTYGRSFLGATNIGQQYRGTGGKEGVFDYTDLPRPGCVEELDSQAGAAYCVGADGGFVTYDNPQTVMMKASFIRENGLAGLFYWEVTGDVKGDRSLVLAGYHGLHA